MLPGTFYRNRIRSKTSNNPKIHQTTKPTIYFQTQTNNRQENFTFIRTIRVGFLISSVTDGLGGGAGVWPGRRGTLNGSAAPPAPPGSIGTLNPSADGGGKLGT